MLRFRACALTCGLAVCMYFLLLGCSSDPSMHPWHTVELDEEFHADMLQSQVRNFKQYQALEERLFAELNEKIYADSTVGPENVLQRYSSGSLADPQRRERDWNRTFEFPTSQPRGGVLLLHGMSDSPYSLRALGEALSQDGYWVVGLRLPGHGTIPSGLTQVTWQDMAAVVGIGMTYLTRQVGSQPTHIIGYSTGASLALNHVLDTLDTDKSALPASLVLISPAIRVSSASALAGFKNFMASFPGLSRWAYLSVMQEFDPYKYNSFATNAGAQVHGITRSITRRIRALANKPAVAEHFPPILILKSTVDATVTTEAVVDHLLMDLPAGRNELVLFDINRQAAVQSTLLVADPGPLTNRLMADDSLPFAVTFIANEGPDSTQLVARYKPAFSLAPTQEVPLNQKWPRQVLSLSHVALPFPPDDPVYGESQPEDEEFIFLGNLALRGERGLMQLPSDWVLRQRHNPFYSYLQSRVFQWLEITAESKLGFLIQSVAAKNKTTG